MVVENAQKRADFQGGTTATLFPYLNKIAQKDQLKIIYVSPTNIETVLTVDIDYSVEGVGQTGGGNVRFPLSGSAFDLTDANSKLTILYNYPLSQTTDYINGQADFLESVEEDLDQTIFKIAELEEKVDRTVKTTEGTNVIPDNFETIALEVENNKNAAETAKTDAETARNEAEAFAQSINIPSGGDLAGEAGKVLTVNSGETGYALEPSTPLSVQGEILIRGANGIDVLGAGTTGQVLTTKGQNANPVWESLSEDPKNSLEMVDRFANLWNSIYSFGIINNAGMGMQFGNVDKFDGVGNFSSQSYKADGIFPLLLETPEFNILRWDKEYNDQVVISTGNKVFVLGKNRTGCLGTGNTNEITSLTEITSVFGSDTIIDVKISQSSMLGYHHTLFLTSGKEVYACGENTYGQLGLGNNTNISTPTKITSISDVKKIWAFGDSTGISFFEKNDGTLWACGYNADGRLGIGTITSVNVPTQITQITSPIQLSCASLTYGVIQNNGSLQIRTTGAFVWCLTSINEVFGWGENSQGQLGGTGNISTPQKITALGTGVTSLDVRYSNNYQGGTSNNTLRLKVNGYIVRNQDIFYWNTSTNILSSQYNPSSTTKTLTKVVLWDDLPLILYTDGTFFHELFLGQSDFSTGLGKEKVTDIALASVNPIHFQNINLSANVQTITLTGTYILDTFTTTVPNLLKCVQNNTFFLLTETGHLFASGGYYCYPFEHRPKTSDSGITKFVPFGVQNLVRVF